MTSAACEHQGMHQAATRSALGYPASQSCSLTHRSQQQGPWPAQQQTQTINRDPGMQSAFRARLQCNGSSSHLRQDAAAMQIEEEGLSSSSNTITAMHQRSDIHSSAEHLQQQHQYQQQLPPHPVHLQNRRTSSEVHSSGKMKRPSMDVSATSMAAAAVSRRSIDAGASSNRRSMDTSAVAAAADRRRSVDVGANAMWAHSSLFSSSAVVKRTGKSRSSVEGATAAAAVVAAAGRRSLDVALAAAAAPDRRTPAAARYSVDLGAAAWMRSSLYSSSSSSATPAAHSSRPRRSSLCADDRMPTAARKAALHGMHAAVHARSGFSPYAVQQQELRACAAAPRSQPQPRTSPPPSLSPFAAAAPQAQLLRTNSGGSSGSAGSSCSSAYDASCQQQQMLHMAMQSTMYGGRDAHAAAAAVAAQQHKQHMTALQVIDEEIIQLSILGQQLLMASRAAPQGSAAAAACEAAITKHGCAMSQAWEARASLEVAAAQSLRSVGSMDLDQLEPELQGYYEAADACAAGTGTDTDDDEEYYTAADHGAMMLNAQHSSAMSLGSVSTNEARSYHHADLGWHTGRGAGASCVQQQQQQQMLTEAQQQKMQQLRALQRMSADLMVMQSELALLKTMPLARQA